MCVFVCVAKPVAVELHCHATALILVIGTAEFRRAMLSCDSSCLKGNPNSTFRHGALKSYGFPTSKAVERILIGRQLGVLSMDGSQTLK